MLWNYFKLSARRLSKDLQFVIINIIGLSFGLATSALVFLFVKDELSYDRFHHNADNIYKVRAQIKGGAFSIGTPPILGETLKEELPGVVDFMRSSFGSARVIVQQNNNFFYEDEFQSMDPSLFQIFDFRLQEGNENTALTDPNSIVISHHIADKYFKDLDPIGKPLTIEGKTYSVSGVLMEIPGNSSFQFNFITNFESQFENSVDSTRKPWDTGTGYLFVLLNKNYALSKFKDDLNRILKEHTSKESGLELEYITEPLTDLHLYNKNTSSDDGFGGKIEYVYTFSIVGILVLLLGLANYINLATAKSSELGREVGVRKVIGATKTQLIFQYIGESMVLVSVAFLVALGIVELLIPFMNQLTGKTIELNYFEDPFVIPSIILLIILISIASSLYTAVIISKINTVSAIKNNLLKSAGRTGLRKILLIFQYTISIGLVVCTLVMHDQLNYLLTSDLGFDRERVIRVDLGFDPAKL